MREAGIPLTEKPCRIHKTDTRLNFVPMFAEYSTVQMTRGHRNIRAYRYPVYSRGVSILAKHRGTLSSKPGMDRSWRGLGSRTAIGAMPRLLSPIPRKCRSLRQLSNLPIDTVSSYDQVC